MTVREQMTIDAVVEGLSNVEHDSELSAAAVGITYPSQPVVYKELFTSKQLSKLLCLTNNTRV